MHLLSFKPVQDHFISNIEAQNLYFSCKVQLLLTVCICFGTTPENDMFEVGRTPENDFKCLKLSVMLMYYLNS